MGVSIMGKSFAGKLLVQHALFKGFYGVGRLTAQKLCSKLGFYPFMKMHQLTEQQILNITKELSEMTIEADARAIVQSNIKAKLGTWKGMRHSLGLPVRGQHSKNNAKTAKRLNRVERRA